MSEIKDNSKVYYWIKLKTDFFESDAIDFLLSQEDGCKYVTLYIKLCTMTSNTNGVLASKIGNILVPYTVDKIARDTKFFSADTVRAALELFQNLRLIVVSENNVMKIANYESMIGSETGWAQKKRLYRENKQKNPSEKSPKKDSKNARKTSLKTEKKSKDKVEDIVQDKVEDIVQDKKRTLSDKRLESRDKSLESRNKSVSSQKLDSVAASKCATNETVQTDCFVKPSISEIVDYIQEHNLNVDAKKFWKHYESTGWKTGNDPIRDWKGLLKKWSKAEREEDNPGIKAIQLDEKFYAKPVQMSEEQLQSELAQLREKIKNGEL